MPGVSVPLSGFGFLIPILLVASATAIACRGDEDLTGPTTGMLEVTTATTGMETDPDGYTVQVDGGPAEAIGSTAAVRRTGVPGGSHTILLGGVAANCTVEGENPRSISMIAGETNTVAFAIVCRPTTGSLEISSETSGTSPDQNGYTVVLDGTSVGALTATGETTLGGLMPGARIVGLGDIAGNCEVVGDNPRTVTITAGATAVAAFIVGCENPPATAGTLRVITETSGPGSDPDGYAFTVDGTGSQPIGVRDTTEVPNVAAGVHGVRLLEVADHCSLQGLNPRSVTVPSGGTAEVTFFLSCQATTGSIEITTTTGGSGSDANGYAFAVDGGSSQSIGVNATAAIPNVSPGSHAVLLSDIAANCSIQSTNPQTVNVVGGGIGTVAFVLTCTAPSSVNIAITTNPPVSALTREVFDPRVQPEVVVRDGSGNPVGGAEVTAGIASGNGTLEGMATATTRASGVAKFGDLGIRGSGQHTLVFTSGTASVSSSPVNVAPLPSEATTGKWGRVVPWDIVPLHINLLPTGKILAWGKTDVADTMGMPRLWDPASGASPSGARMVEADTMLFCAGHTIMPDGRVMVSGGHLKDDRGLDVTNIFDPASESWVPGLPRMAHARWYPTVTTLPNGRLLTMGGRNETGAQVTIPEIWEGGRWVQLPGAGTYVTPYYPRNFVDPTNGRIFYAGERIQSRWFEVDASSAGGRGRWISGPSHIYPYNRDYGSAVMYETGKILYVGGGGMKNWGGGTWSDAKRDVPTETAETIDLTRSNPTWQSTGSMAFRRRHMNATILPDGQVLATGGTRGGGIGILTNIDPALAVHEAEIWNPATGQWTTLARNSPNHMRLYHSVSLLLPDGTVLNGASGDAMTVAPGGGEIPVPPEKNHEIFSPPYLFKGARPTITSAPASVGYGQTFSVATPNAAQITGVRWIKLGSVTHAHDASAQANTLSFTINGGNVGVTAPLSSMVAPPGHYLLYILNRNGVPSEGKVVKVQ